jgi:hypothetical protein
VGKVKVLGNKTNKLSEVTAIKMIVTKPVIIKARQTIVRRSIQSLVTFDGRVAELT